MYTDTVRLYEYTQWAQSIFWRRFDVEISTSIFNAFSTPYKKPLKYGDRFDVKSTSKLQFRGFFDDRRNLLIFFNAFRRRNFDVDSTLKLPAGIWHEATVHIIVGHKYNWITHLALAMLTYRFAIRTNTSPMKNRKHSSVASWILSLDDTNFPSSNQVNFIIWWKCFFRFVSQQYLDLLISFVNSIITAWTHFICFISVDIIKFNSANVFVLKWMETITLNLTHVNAFGYW